MKYRQLNHRCYNLQIYQKYHHHHQNQICHYIHLVKKQTSF
uniref:Uncharacterized protein n=1 Tax=Arundo donax TaxID=35708 RepID=A0A0A9EG33_ARUDO